MHFYTKKLYFNVDITYSAGYKATITWLPAFPSPTCGHQVIKIIQFPTHGKLRPFFVFTKGGLAVCGAFIVSSWTSLNAVSRMKNTLRRHLPNHDETLLAPRGNGYFVYFPATVIWLEVVFWTMTANPFEVSVILALNVIFLPCPSHSPRNPAFDTRL